MKEYYRTFKVSDPIFTIEEIDSVLLECLNENQEEIQIFLSLFETFANCCNLKKGKEHAVVLETSDILEEILQQNLEQPFSENFE